METPKCDLTPRLWNQTGLVQILALLLAGSVACAGQYACRVSAKLGRGSLQGWSTHLQPIPSRLLVQKANSQSPSQMVRAPLCGSDRQGPGDDSDAPQCVRDSRLASCEQSHMPPSRRPVAGTPIVYGAVPRRRRTDLNQVIESLRQPERQACFHSHFTERETEDERGPDAPLSREGLNNSRLPSCSPQGRRQSSKGKGQRAP